MSNDHHTHNTTLAVRLSPPDHPPQWGLIGLDLFLEFKSGASHFGINVRRISTVNIRYSNEPPYMGQLFIGFGKGSLIWAFFQKAQPLIDYFEHIRTQYDCDWFLTVDTVTQQKGVNRV